MTGAESDEQLPAGGVTEWVTELLAAVEGSGDARVACGVCTACCASSQFIHIRPDETDTLSHIPAALLFPAPRAPRGHVLMGYDELGRCPMLIDGACSIYAHRPRTCRTYDCRVFAAAGLDALDDGKPDIARQSRRWVFTTDDETDRATLEAVRAAARRLPAELASLQPGSSALPVTQLAVLAVEVHEVFLDRAAETPTVTEPTSAAVHVELRRRLGLGR